MLPRYKSTCLAPVLDTDEHSVVFPETTFYLLRIHAALDEYLPPLTGTYWITRRFT
jgi:hypothetical protein